MTTILTAIFGQRLAKHLAPLVWAVLGAIALVALIWWQRLDAVSDYKAGLSAEIAEQRLGDTKHAKELRDALENMDDIDLFDFLSRSVSRPDPETGGAVRGRCDPPAAVQPDGGLLAQ